MMEDKRSKNVALVSFCIMCQAFQARGIVKYDWKATIKPILRELIENEINIIQLPCPESSYNGFCEGLKREPMGLSKYDTKDFHEHCQKLVLDSIKIVEGLIENGYKINAIIGIENSPSCAVNYIYTRKGMLNRKGIFMTHLEEQLITRGITIPFVGVNRKSPRKSVEQLHDAIIKYETFF
ncbi:MAG: 2-thiouracil desulfurase family protein [Clostridiales bacterium]|jgi:predicted secreted protein|nr:2-thiouracil desulfurase family protein [Clostridiales bacterium]